MGADARPLHTGTAVVLACGVHAPATVVQRAGVKRTMRTLFRCTGATAGAAVAAVMIVLLAAAAPLVAGSVSATAFVPSAAGAGVCDVGDAKFCACCSTCASAACVGKGSCQADASSPTCDCTRFQCGGSCGGAGSTCDSVRGGAGCSGSTHLEDQCVCGDEFVAVGGTCMPAAFFARGPASAKVGDVARTAPAFDRLSPLEAARGQQEGATAAEAPRAEYLPPTGAPYFVGCAVTLACVVLAAAVRAGLMEALLPGVPQPAGYYHPAHVAHPRLCAAFEALRKAQVVVVHEGVQPAPPSHSAGRTLRVVEKLVPKDLPVSSVSPASDGAAAVSPPGASAGSKRGKKKQQQQTRRGKRKAHRRTRSEPIATTHVCKVPAPPSTPTPRGAPVKRQLPMDDASAAADSAPAARLKVLLDLADIPPPPGAPTDTSSGSSRPDTPSYMLSGVDMGDGIVNGLLQAGTVGSRCSDLLSATDPSASSASVSSNQSNASGASTGKHHVPATAKLQHIVSGISAGVSARRTAKQIARGRNSVATRVETMFDSLPQKRSGVPENFDPAAVLAASLPKHVLAAAAPTTATPQRVSAGSQQQHNEPAASPERASPACSPRSADSGVDEAASRKLLEFLQSGARQHAEPAVSTAAPVTPPAAATPLPRPPASLVPSQARQHILLLLSHPAALSPAAACASPEQPALRTPVDTRVVEQERAEAEAVWAGVHVDEQPKPVRSVSANVAKTQIVSAPRVADNTEHAVARAVVPATAIAVGAPVVAPVAVQLPPQPLSPARGTDTDGARTDGDGSVDVADAQVERTGAACDFDHGSDAASDAGSDDTDVVSVVEVGDRASPVASPDASMVSLSSSQVSVGSAQSAPSSRAALPFSARLTASWADLADEDDTDFDGFGTFLSASDAEVASDSDDGEVVPKAASPALRRVTPERAAAVRGVVATPCDSSVRVEWLCASGRGGVEFVVTAQPTCSSVGDVQEVRTTRSSAVLDGLRNGCPYSVSVTAAGEAASSACAKSPITPTASALLAQSLPREADAILHASSPWLSERDLTTPTAAELGVVGVKLLWAIFQRYATPIASTADPVDARLSRKAFTSLAVHSGLAAVDCLADGAAGAKPVVRRRPRLCATAVTRCFAAGVSPTVSDAREGAMLTFSGFQAAIVAAGRSRCHVASKRTHLRRSSSGSVSTGAGAGAGAGAVDTEGQVTCAGCGGVAGAPAARSTSGVGQLLDHHVVPLVSSFAQGDCALGSGVSRSQMRASLSLDAVQTVLESRKGVVARLFKAARLESGAGAAVAVRPAVGLLRAAAIIPSQSSVLDAVDAFALAAEARRGTRVAVVSEPQFATFLAYVAMRSSACKHDGEDAVSANPAQHLAALLDALAARCA